MVKIKSMIQEEIFERNKEIATMIGLKQLLPYRDGAFIITDNTAKYFNIKLNSGAWRIYLIFHSDWKWLMETVNYIHGLGYRKYSYSHEDHARCVFTDMAIRHQEHNFGGGNIVSDSGECNTEMEAIFIAVSNFAKFYNKECNVTND